MRTVRRRIGSWIRGLTGANEAVETRHDVASIRARLDEIAGRVEEISAATVRHGELVAIERERRRIELDDLANLQRQLASAREGGDYDAAYDEAEPLISVRIASHLRTRQLLEVAVSSVLSQTYSNFEIVVVNDGRNPRTRAALADLGDLRIRYDELPARGLYPELPHSRWQVAGTPAGNRGIELARGRWIAPLDEDDSFTPHHLERLLALAREHRAELAYGALLARNLVTGGERVLWSDPPEHGMFSLQAALYHRALSFITYEPLAWTIDEPGDWNLTRRMLRAGVRTASTQEIVGTLNWVPIEEKPTHPWAAPS